MNALNTIPSKVKSFHQSSALSGTVHVPGDKSITHRAILFGMLAEGETQVINWLDAADCRSSMSVAEQLGANISIEDTRLLIVGTGGALKEPEDVLDCGNSGTTTRLLLGALGARVPFACVTGDASLRARPMARVINPLLQMGADIRAKRGKFAPLAVTGRPLTGIEYVLPVASAQVKSALLMAGMLAADGETTVIEPEPTRNHTETMLPAFGVSVEARDTASGLVLRVGPNQRLHGATVEVPGDISSAAFLLAAAAIVPGSRVTVQNVGLNPTRTGFLKVMERMGAQMQLENLHVVAGETIGDVTVSCSPLRGTDVLPAEIPSMVDELPLLAILASYAEGVTKVRGAEELRVKETDRIAAMVEGITAVGGDITEHPDGFTVRGSGGLRGGEVESYHDHRVAMSFVVAALASSRPIAIRNWACMNISYPTFLNSLAELGANLNGELRK